MPTFLGSKSQVLPTNSTPAVAFERGKRPLPGEERIIEQLIGYNLGAKDPNVDWREQQFHLSSRIAEHRNLLERTREEREDRDKRKDILLKTIAEEAQRNILESRYPTTMYKLTRLRQCILCKDNFRRIDSIGRWQCWRHTGVVDPMQRQWTCCGRDPGLRILRGCTRCDHTDLFPQRDGRHAWSTADPDLIALIRPPIACIREGPPMVVGETEQQYWKEGPLDPLVSKRDTLPPQEEGRTLIHEGMADHEVFMVKRARKMPDGFYFPSRYWLREGEGGERQREPPKEQKPQWILLTTVTDPSPLLKE